MIESYVTPPHSPKDCIFALTTACVSANFEKRITPCQFGGNPDCANCGCIASAALAAVGRHRLPGGIRVGAIFEQSLRIGAHVKAVRDGDSGRAPGADRCENAVAPSLAEYGLHRKNCRDSDKSWHGAVL